MKAKNMKLIVLFMVAMLAMTGCQSVEQTGINNEINAVEDVLTQKVDTTTSESEVTENVSEESSSTESESVEVTEETKEEFTESNTSESKKEEPTKQEPVEEVVESDVVASGVLEDADIEWEIVGTTLYIRGEGAIPDFPVTMLQARRTPDLLELVRDWQFYDEIVEKIVIEEGVTKIGKSNFDGFKKVKEIVFADSVTEVGKWACNSLRIESLDLNNIAVIGEQAFGNLVNLKSVVIPGTVKKLGDSAFLFSNSLTEIYIEEGVGEIQEAAFRDIGQNVHVYLNSNTTKIDDYAFDSNYTFHVKEGSNAEAIVKTLAYQETLTIVYE